MTAPPKPLSARNSGLYLAPQTLSALRQAAVDGGFAWYNLDLTRVTSKTRLLAVCGRDLEFPETFGANWDALADCLQDFSWWRAPGYVINVTHAADCARAAPEDFGLLLEILNAAAKYWKKQGKAFLVLIDYQPHGFALSKL